MTAELDYDDTSNSKFYKQFLLFINEILIYDE